MYSESLLDLIRGVIDNQVVSGDALLCMEDTKVLVKNFGKCS